MFTTTIRHESTTLPGVAFAVHRAGLTRRIEIDKRTLPLRSRMAEIRAEYPPHTERELDLIDQTMLAARKADAVEPADVPTALAEVRALQAESRAAASTDVRKKRAALDTEWEDLETQVRAEWIRAGLVSIEGGEFDGATPEQVLEHAPPALAGEIYRAVASEGLLLPDAAKNSPSPSTLPPVGATNTTAGGASGTGST